MRDGIKAALHRLHEIVEDGCECAVCRNTQDSLRVVEKHIAELESQLAACTPYLKEGEAIAECIKRNRQDVDSVLGLLAAEKRNSEQLREACQSVLDAWHNDGCINGPNGSMPCRGSYSLRGEIFDALRIVRAALAKAEGRQ